MTRSALPIFALTLLLTACSAQQVAQRPASAFSNVASHGQRYEPASSTSPLLFASSSNPCGCIRIFKQRTGALVGLISNGSDPTGLATDDAGNLYVADPVNGDVLVYAPGTTSPSYALQGFGNSSPISVVVRTDGTVFVSVSGPTASVFVFAGGARTPTSMLFDGHAAIGTGVAIDKRGNLYWGFLAADGSGQVDKFTKGKGHPINTGLSLAQVPIGLAFDKSDHLIVSDATEVLIIALPHTILGMIASGTNPYGIALNSFGRIFLADRNGTPAHIEVRDYPSGVLERTIVTPNFAPFGLAISPRFQPSN